MTIERKRLVLYRSIESMYQLSDPLWGIALWWKVGFDIYF